MQLQAYGGVALHRPYLSLFALELKHGEGGGGYCFARKVKRLTQFSDTSKVEEAKRFQFFCFKANQYSFPLHVQILMQTAIFLYLYIDVETLLFML